MYEGYGMVLTEAATRGLPIISTTAGAIPNTLKSINAVLVPPGDTQSLAKAMEQALAGESRNSEGFTIRANQAQKHFPDWKSTTKTFEEAGDSEVHLHQSLAYQWELPSHQLWR